MGDVHVVIPMAGRGERFARQGYGPKPLLPIEGRPMFEWVILNMLEPQVADFTLVVRPDVAANIDAKRLERMVNRPVRIVKVDSVTGGAAETVLRGLATLPHRGSVVTANSDQLVKGSLRGLYEIVPAYSGGCILTMRANDDRWSFVGFDDSGSPSVVVEKEVISEIATVGIYAFAGRDVLQCAIEEMLDRDVRTNGEYYLAPVYNILLGQKLSVGHLEIGTLEEEIIGLGVPEDYERARQDISVHEFLAKLELKILARE